MQNIPEPPSTTRVIGYVDGYNLYYGLMSKGWGQYRWLDVHALLATFLRPPQHLVEVKYFTARSSHPPDRFQRHTTYLNALRRSTGVVVKEGIIYARWQTCPNPECDAEWTRNQEKQTDVSIAIDMLVDSLDGRADEIFLLSADSDLVPAIRTVQERFGVAVTVIDPPVTTLRRPHQGSFEATSHEQIAHRRIAAAQSGQARPSGHESYPPSGFLEFPRFGGHLSYAARAA